MSWSLCSPDQAGLELKSLPVSASRVLRLKVCATAPDFQGFFMRKWEMWVSFRLTRTRTLSRPHSLKLKQRHFFLTPHTLYFTETSKLYPTYRNGNHESVSLNRQEMKAKGFRTGSLQQLTSSLKDAPPLPSPSSDGFGSCSEASKIPDGCDRPEHHASTVSQSQERGCCF